LKKIFILFQILQKLALILYKTNLYSLKSNNMTLLEETFKDMQRVSISFLRTNESVWTDLVAIKANIILLEKNYKELEDSIAAQKANNTGGPVDQKSNMTEDMVARFYALDCQLSFYAKDKEDLVLLSDVNYSESTLEEMKEENQVTTFALILKRAKEYLPKLTDYNVKADELTELEDDFELWKKMPDVVDQTSNLHKSATRSIKTINRAARKIFNKLDDAFDGNFAGNTKFLEDWYEARKIKGRPIRKRKNNGGTDAKK
jgi:hypothetical protein